MATVQLRPKRERGLLWQASEDGTYPDVDRCVHNHVERLLVLDPELCWMCEKLTFSVLVAEAEPFGYKHHGRMTDLLSAADRGCRMCIWICSALFFQPWLEGQHEKGGTRAPVPEDYLTSSPDGRQVFMRSNHSGYRYPPILRYSRSANGIIIRNPHETTERNILRIYTNHGLS